MFSLGVFFMVGVAQADTIELNPNRPEKYVVQKGDTLWDISERFLRDPWKWKEVWQGNPQIENPHLIYPGDIVALIFRDGEPVLVVNGQIGEPTVKPQDRIVRLSPQIRVSEHETAIRKIQFDFLENFAQSAMVITKDEMEHLPYIFANVDFGKSLAGSKDEELYVRGLNTGQRRARYSIFRDSGLAYTNPLKDPNEILGYEARYIGDVVIQDYGDPALAKILSAKEDIHIGDRLLPSIAKGYLGEIILNNPTHTVDGNIISIVEGLHVVGQYQTVVVDIGSAHDVKVGDALGIYQDTIVKDEIARQQNKKKREERRIVVEYEDESGFNKELSIMINGLRDLKTEFTNSKLVQYLGAPQDEEVSVALPSKYIGALVILRVFPQVSYGLVLNIEGPIHLLDSVKNL